jgi:hypothetical protein
MKLYEMERSLSWEQRLEEAQRAYRGLIRLYVDLSRHGTTRLVSGVDPNMRLKSFSQTRTAGQENTE